MKLKSKCFVRFKHQPIIFLSVLPEKVTIDDFSQNHDPVGCNGTRRVQWQLINVGSCSVEYTIEFKNSAQDVIGTVKDIKNKTFFYCTSDFDNAASVIMWATYKGTQGIRSEVKYLSPLADATTSTTTTVLTTATHKGTQGIKSEVKYLSAAPDRTTSTTTTVLSTTTRMYVCKK